MAALIFGFGLLSPPHLMDDVDAVQAQIARNMLNSGDWVTARLDGISYLEKSPLLYWMMAAAFRVLGVHDWVARIPLALCTAALCCVVGSFGRWAFHARTGAYAGLILATCIGLFLFTRILIPDAIVTLTVTLSVWSWLRLLDPEERRARIWAAVLGASLGFGLLLKGLIAIVFPLVPCLLFMVLTREAFAASTWRRLHLLLAVTVCAVIALPWHVLATLQNPPYFEFTLHSEPGKYRGFFWFYFFNEHLLRFLNLRYPRDYNTVPRLWFWLLNLVWLFPWSAYLPGLFQLNYSENNRAGRTRLLALCWISTVMVFFSFSTTQEYYSMPIYPALALLLACSVQAEGKVRTASTRALAVLAASLSIGLLAVLFLVRTVPTPGDIVQALNQHPEMYTLSLGHMGDLTLRAFAYLKLPLLLAGIAFAVCAAGLFRSPNETGKVVFSLCVGMVLFFQAARLALVRFDSYLSSYRLADALSHAPPGEFIESDAYYAFSSVFFYANRSALLWNGRANNLEYGSYAPGAAQVFIDDQGFVRRWKSNSRFYLVTYDAEIPRTAALAGPLYVVAQQSGARLLTNKALP